MDIHPSFLLFVVTAAFTPGPNNIMMMTSGLNFGVRSSLPHLLGICFGVPVMLLAVGLGLGFVFERYAVVHEIIQVIGVLYLIYLAWVIARAEPNTTTIKRSKPLSFLQAALFQWVNPKAWVLGTSAIAAYTVVGENLTLQVLTIALVFSVITFPAAGSWLVFGATLKRLLSNPLHRRIFNWAMALLLLVSVHPVVRELAQKYLF